MKMKTTAPNPLFAKIRLFLIVLTSCVIATCIFLIIIHPEVWMIPACGIIIALCILLYQGILHTQEPEENLNVLLLFQFFGNSDQLFVPFFTELTD